MNKFLELVLAATSLFTATSCVAVTNEKDTRITWEVPVEAFASIYNNVSYDIQYVQSDSYGVTVKAPKELRDYVKIYVKSGTLVVTQKFSFKSLSTRYGVSVKVRAPKLNSVKLTGSGDFTADNIKSDELKVMTSGSGDINIGKLACSGDASFATFGSGDIRIGSGNISIDAQIAGFLSLRSTGSGDIKAKVSGARDAEIRSTGSGDISCDIKASGVVSATTTGSGDIWLSGTAGSVKQHSSGSGDIQLDVNGLKTN